MSTDSMQISNIFYRYMLEGTVPCAILLKPTN